MTIDGRMQEKSSRGREPKNGRGESRPSRVVLLEPRVPRLDKWEREICARTGRHPKERSAISVKRARKRVEKPMERCFTGVVIQNRR